MSTTENLARAIRAKDEAADQAALEAAKQRFDLAGLDARAERTLAFLGAHTDEAARILKETDTDARDREANEHKHPSLRVYYEAVDDARDALRGCVFGTISTLMRGRAGLAALTVADLVPHELVGERWLSYPRWGGRIPPRVFRIYEQLSATVTPADIATRLERLRAARAELDEHLRAVAGLYAPTGGLDAPAR